MLMPCYDCKTTSWGEAGVFHQLLLEDSAEEWLLVCELQVESAILTSL